MMAHMNSTGNHVPIFVNADPSRWPSIGMSMPNDSGSDAAIMEGVFFGNMLAHNPPEAYFVRGKGFKANIPGRLGASSSNPYKPFEGYRFDEGGFYSARADKLCYQSLMSDGVHADFRACQASNYAYGPNVRSWPNVLTTYVNSNYNGLVSQNFTQRTFDFNSEAVGHRTENAGELWTTTANFEFSNTVSMYTSGIVSIEDWGDGNKHLCQGGSSEHIVITKNTGEPFSLVKLDAVKNWSGGGTTMPSGCR